jgi:hypothetical protein
VKQMSAVCCSKNGWQSERYLHQAADRPVSFRYRRPISLIFRQNQEDSRMILELCWRHIPTKHFPTTYLRQVCKYII